MKNEMTERQKLYLKKIKAAEKVKSIESKMVSSAEGGRIILVPLEQLKKLVPELRQAEAEYHAAVAEFLDCLSGSSPKT